MGPGPRSVLQIFPYKLIHYNVQHKTSTESLRCAPALLHRFVTENIIKGLSKFSVRRVGREQKRHKVAYQQPEVWKSGLQVLNPVAFRWMP